MKGNVYVHYVDTEGNIIKDSVTDELAQPVGKDYDTVVDNRPKEIEFQGKTYELVPAGNYPVGKVTNKVTGMVMMLQQVKSSKVIRMLLTFTN